MKTYYFTLANDIPKNGSWSDAPQKNIDFKSWSDFIDFCRNVATSFNTVVRACESNGYNNQGSYINKY